MMMKKYGLITKVLLISMFAILLNGCENSLTSEFSSKANEAKFYTITGNIDVDAISAENSSRTGLPTIPSINDNSIKFSVSATKDGKIITGTVTGNQYSITLLKGSWTITVIGEKAGVKVLEGSINVNPEDEPTTQQTITLKTINAGTGTGSLSLTITKDSGLSCGVVKATLYKTSTDITEKNLTFDTTNSTTWDVKDLNAGTYEIKLDFYQEMTNTNGEYSCENLLYSHHDTVNVFANLTTNTWTGSGYSEDKTTFTLTQAMIDNFAMSTFYVDGTNGNDSKAGTYFAPFKTLQEAVTAINEKTDTSTEFTIYLLDGEFTLSEQIEISKKIRITTYNSENDIAIIKRDSNFKSGYLIKVSSGGELTLANVTIDGNQVENDYSGIYVEGTLNLNDKATIQNCTASEGGGVFIWEGELTMNSGATISNCTASEGGGVYLLEGNFTMNGGTIGGAKQTINGIEKTFGCTAEKGGGVYVADGEFNMSDTASIDDCNALSTSDSRYGGGVYLAGGSFNMTGGSIKNCKVTGYNDYGGGVYISSGEFTMSGGTISWSSDDYCAERGGGVYMNAGTFTMSGSAKIEGCKTYSLGGGVYQNGGKFTMSGGTISGCKAEQGGGVYKEKGSFEMQGGTIGGKDNSLGCTANQGGGVYLGSLGSSSISSGTISNCSATSQGGGIYYNGSTNFPFTMYSGEISNCTAEQGGGVYINNGEFKMSGSAKIDNCEASEKGGGVYQNDGRFEIFYDEDGTNDVIISNNTAKSGGGVCVYSGTFSMNSGSISGNEVKSDSAQGGGVLVIGNFFMHNGNITNNRLEYECIDTTLISGGAGVAVSLKVGNNGALQTGAFTMNGGKISGNTIIDTYNHAKGEDLFVISGGTFTPNGGTINNDKIYNDNNW